MKAILIVALALPLLLAVYLGWQSLDPVQVERRQDRAYYRSERERLELERQRAEQAAALAWTEARQAGYSAAELALIAGLPVALLAFVGLAGLHYWRRQALVWPNAAGDLPVPYADVVGGRLNEISARLLELRKLAEIGAAQRPVLPAHLVYNPRLDCQYKPVAPQLVDQAPAALLALPAPTFAGLLGNVIRPDGGQIVFGADAETGELVMGGWADLYSTAVGGLSGSGKSWTAAALLCQSALQGAKIALLDPHGGNAESLTTRLAPLASTGAYLCQPARSLAEQDAAISLITEELARRKAADRPGVPWVVAMDEFAALQRSSLGPQIAALLEALGQEGRKYGVYGLACSQVWTAARSGGTETRDALASAFVHRLRPARARYLTGLSAENLPGDLLELPAGCAYLLSTSGELRKVQVPRMTPADVVAVAGLLGGQAASTPASTPASRQRPMGFVPASTLGPGGSGTGSGTGSGAGAAASTAAGRARSLTPEEARIVADFRAGKSAMEIARALAGGATGGRAYQDAAERVARALRKALGGR